MRLHFAQVHLKYINVLFKHFSCSVLKFKVRKTFLRYKTNNFRLSSKHVVQLVIISFIMRQSCYAQGHLSFRLYPIKSVRLIIVFSSQKLQLNFSIYSAAGSKIGSVTAFVKLICNYHFADVKLQFAHMSVETQ